ncbi:response regulator [Alteromonas confluentis]|uniref:Response regulatory domain-containing protein n=1 Tax=Alteromonas confluentis TaxID=1656094 RepID=A0A1E7Z7F2_9ALTE|nr:response regulator [Alteromonas confluentis]OFC69455.1 hypothetical protein BFC18_18810 [Alteromonas confluentis]
MKILFVDDEPMILNGIRRALYRSGWKISIADGPQKALDALQDIQPDVIFSDAIMPGMNGVQFLQQISEISPCIARFILSGQADENLVLQGSQVVHGWYTKPCSHTLLNEQLEIISAIAAMLPVEAPDVAAQATASPLFAPLSLLKQHMQCVNGQVCALGNADISKFTDDQKQALFHVAETLFNDIDTDKIKDEASLAHLTQSRFPLLLLTEVFLRAPELIQNEELKTQITLHGEQFAERDNTDGMALLINLLKPILRDKLTATEHISVDTMLLYMLHVWSLPYSVIHKTL